MAKDLIIIKDTELTQSTWVSNPYVALATSDNTRKAYQSDIRHFENWGGRLPANPEAIVIYLQHHAQTLNPRTLSRRLTALKNWHLYQNFPDPTVHPAITKTLAGIVRTHGKPKEKAWPLAPEGLLKMVQRLQKDGSLIASRDNALLQIGFFGAFRRSELVAIQIEDLNWMEEGIEILIPKSKTDPNHIGQFCAIPFGDGDLCPVTALKHWLEKSHIKSGPIFRRIFLNNEIDIHALSALSVNIILKKYAHACKLPYADRLSSHSLRRGLATSASQSGAGLPAIMRQGRWKQVNTVMEYIEATERFKENAASSIMQNIKKETK